VLSAAPTEASDAVAVPAKETAALGGANKTEEQTEGSAVLDITTYSSESSVLNVGEANCDSVWDHNPHQSLEIPVCHELLPCKLFCSRSINAIDFVRGQTPSVIGGISARTSSAPMATLSVSKLPEISLSVLLVLCKLLRNNLWLSKILYRWSHASRFVQNLISSPPLLLSRASFQARARVRRRAANDVAGRFVQNLISSPPLLLSRASFQARARVRRGAADDVAGRDGGGGASNKS
jgi:hypothetical protein